MVGWMRHNGMARHDLHDTDNVSIGGSDKEVCWQANGVGENDGA